MRKSGLSLCLFLPLFLTAQHEFAPLGAKWYYSYVQWFPPSGDEIIELEVTGIDTIQGRACKRIHNSLHWGCSDCNPELHVYQENGKVFRLIDSTFQLFIDFNANAGDSWVVNLNGFNQDSIIIKVNSISWVSLPNGPPLRVQHISLFGSNSWTWGGEITEKLGSSFFMCPQFSTCDPLISPLVCYSDPTIEVPINCSATIAVYEPEKIIYKGLIFPNPANDIISIPEGFEADELVLQDMLGKQQYRRWVKPGEQFLISNLPSSIYVASLLKNGRLIGVDKLVVLKKG